jgi:hypothetical protein
MRVSAIVALLFAIAGCNKDEPRPAVAVTSTAGEPAREQAVVTASRGQVELVRDGNVSAVKVGDRLGVRDALRTGDGEADLAVDGVKVRLHEASRLELQDVQKRAVRARVRGSVESEVENGKLDVAIEDSDAVAHSEGGHFFVTADGRGVVAVASVTGTVHLSGAGKSVEVSDGKVGRVLRSGEAPSEPSAALRRVLLSVQWPGQRETNKATMPVVGRVEPGSRVFVQGQPVTVEAGGGFRAQVPLKKGKQKIAVVTVDALGRRKQVDTVVLRDDSLPDARVKKKLWQWR